MMCFVHRKWGGFRALSQPNWHRVGPVPAFRAVLWAMSDRLQGHQAHVLPAPGAWDTSGHPPHRGLSFACPVPRLAEPAVTGLPGQLALFGRAA